ncbi:YqiJ family protein [Sphingomonas hylomeconis]|uniref:YqiJ family protein n=1 Tax=Sphingomonas hylomeconis TaxID=1395958 RepID=A0ABV7SZI6_9SPHN|nr:YqiJ family protein [Sphingomonas hylomeconis]
MLNFIAASENVVFVSALLLMVLIGVVQAIGLSVDTHLDADLDSHPDLLGWLGVGRLPLLMLLVVFLALFGTIGLVGQQALHDITGHLLAAWIAIPLAVVAALPLTGFAARGLARILPGDHTTAITLDDLVGEPARIVTGRATHGSPARARVEDQYGQAHYVMVEPNSASETFEEGEAILLVRRENDLFRAISRGDHRLPHIGV